MSVRIRAEVQALLRRVMVDVAGLAIGGPDARVVIPVGGITALIGANDAGKSTLLRALRDSLAEMMSTGSVQGLYDEEPWVHLRAPSALIVDHLAGADLSMVPASGGLRELIVELGPRPRVFVAAPAGIVRCEPGLGEIAARRRIDTAAYPDWAAVPLLELQPAALESLRMRMPAVLELPATPAALDALLLTSIGALLESFTSVRNLGLAGHLRRFGMPSLEDDRLRYWQHWRALHPGDPWLFPRLELCDGQEEVHPDLWVATAIVSILVERAVPEFVAAHYRVDVVPTPLSTWVRGGSRAWIAARNHSPGSSPFPAADLAEGFRLWVQLAVLEACEATTTLSRWITDLVTSPPVAAGESRHLKGWLEDIEPLLAPLVGFRVLPGTDDSAPQLDVETTLEALVRSSSPVHDSHGLDDLGREARSIAILDEPERHLHPSLQRAAAAWLEARSRDTGASSVIATHSVSFMAIDPSAHFLYVRRDHNGVPTVAPIDPAELSAADTVADELGLDRGELLALVRRVVFVEGATDRAFIEALYGPELRHAGIVLVPLAGARNVLSVVPISELLLRFTSAPALVIVDDLPREVIETLRSDATARKTAMRNKKVELRELAKLMQIAVEAERAITCEAISVKDIFDFIEVGVVRDVLVAPGKRPFPGHEEARKLGVDTKWKADYQQRYGLDILDERTFAMGGAEMRRRGLDVPELRSLLGL